MDAMHYRNYYNQFTFSVSKMQLSSKHSKDNNCTTLMFHHKLACTDTLIAASAIRMLNTLLKSLNKLLAKPKKMASRNDDPDSSHVLVVFELSCKPSVIHFAPFCILLLDYQCLVAI